MHSVSVCVKLIWGFWARNTLFNVIGYTYIQQLFCYSNGANNLVITPPHPSVSSLKRCHVWHIPSRTLDGNNLFYPRYNPPPTTPFPFDPLDPVPAYLFTNKIQSEDGMSNEWPQTMQSIICHSNRSLQPSPHTLDNFTKTSTCG